MFWKAKKSKELPTGPFAPGLIEGSLKPCGPKPNCVCSVQDTENEHYIDPIQSENIEATWDKLNSLLDSFNLEVLNSSEGYLHATATTTLMKFVDDVEFLLDKENNFIQIRSASRVGYSDLGANRKRVQAIKKALSEI